MEPGMLLGEESFPNWKNFIMSGKSPVFTISERKREMVYISYTVIGLTKWCRQTSKIQKAGGQNLRP
ncbi:hypothetical protein ES703_53570 [subsurface metagenome]